MAEREAALSVTTPTLTFAVSGGRVPRPPLALIGGRLREMPNLVWLEQLIQDGTVRAFRTWSSRKVESELGQTVRVNEAGNAVVQGDVEFENVGRGIVVKSDDGTRWRLIATNAGEVGWELVG